MGQFKLSLIKGDIVMTKSSEILDRLIACDTEYHCDNIGKIDKVYCVCCTDNNGKQFKKWLDNQNDPNLLNEIKDYYNIEDPIYVCHFFEGAERRAFKFLGVDCSKYNFLCTYYLAKMLQNTFDRRSKRLEIKHKVFESESDVIEASNAAKKVKEDSLSYAGLCHKYNLALIDTEHKAAMRKLCIDNTTKGYEKDILDYCAEDTRFLIPLFKNLFNEYAPLLNNSFCPLNPKAFRNIDVKKAVKALLLQARYLNDFGDISDVGLPVDLDRVEKVKHNAPEWRDELKRKFNAKYPGVYTYNEKKKTFSRCDSTVQEYLRKCIDRLNIKNYPVTDSGKLATSKDILKDYFKNTESFGEDYRQHTKLVTILNKVSGNEDNPLNSIVDGKLWYESLEPCGAITGRCAPKRKFIFGWHKSLYGILNPPKGKWLVELDYGSEETFIQACICKDIAYNDIYNSKDIYLAFADKMGMINHKDWETLSASELTKKYETVRSIIKPMVLGMSYGMGPDKLAARLGIPVEKARAYLAVIKKTIHRSTTYKQSIPDFAAVYASKAFSTLDGFICKYNASDANHTTITNFPFQSGGSMILKHLVHNLMTEYRNGNLNATILATIHDAIFFEVNEGDHDTIQQVSDTMKDVACKVLSAPAGWSIKVGEPAIIKHGEIWTPEHKFDAQFEELLNFNQSEC